MEQKSAKIFGIPKTVFFLGLVSLFTDVSSEMIYPLLPIFLTLSLGAGPAFLGIIEGIAESTASLLKLFSGIWADKSKNKKTLVVFGYGISTFARPLMAVASSWAEVLLIRFSDRVGKGIRTSPRDAIISLSVSPDERGKAFGFHRSMDHLGAVIGPLLAFVILLLFPENLRLLFALSVIPGIIALYILVFHVKESGDSNFSGKFRFNLKGFDNNFKIYLLIMILFTLGNSSDAFLLLKAQESGIKIKYIPLLWVILHITKSIFSTPSGIISDRIGRKKMIIFGWLVYFAVYTGFALSSSSLAIVALFIFYGLFFALTEGVEKAFVADMVSEEKRGSAYGMFNFAIGISALPSSILMGAIWQKYGSETAFLWGAFLALISAVLFTTLIRDSQYIEQSK